MSARSIRSLWPLLPLLLAFVGLLAAGPARAATLTVTTTADRGTGSLRSQIAAASAGDTITFASGVTGTITLTSGQLTIGQSLTLTGPGATTLAVDGSHASRIFAVTGGTVGISGLTIQHGQAPNNSNNANDPNAFAGGGVLVSGGSLTLTGCTLQGNAAGGGGQGGGGGGGLFVRSAATLIDCTLSGNTTPDTPGGGVSLNGSAANVALIGCALSGNTGTYGGGVYNGFGTVTVTACTLSGNSAPVQGGGIQNFGTLRLTDDVLYGDTGGGDTGGEIGYGSAAITVDHCDVQGGLPSGVTDSGGNLNADPKFLSATSPYDLRLQSTSPCFRAGTANGAPATDHDGQPYGSPPSIGAYELADQSSQDYVVTNTNDSGAGSLRAAMGFANVHQNTTVTFAPSVTGTITLTSGALPNVTQNLTLTGPGAGVLAVDGNQASRVFAIMAGRVAISGLTIQNGHPPASNADPFIGEGGGVYNGDGNGYDNGTVTLTGCTLAGNTAGSDGGGIFNAGTLTLNGCTLSGNTEAGGFGGGGIRNDGALTLTGCTLSGNSVHSGNGGGGIFNDRSLTMTDCTLSRNTSVVPGGYSGGGGVCNTNTATLTHCTLAGNIAQHGGAVYNPSGTTTLTDDILYGDTAVDSEIFSNTGVGTSVTATRCDVQGGYAGAGNLNAAPLFVATADLHLQAGSPCIGAGTAVAGVTTDLDGQPYFTPPAIGAYEGPRDVATDTHVLWDNPDGRTIFWDVNAQGAYWIAGNYAPLTDPSGSGGYTAVSLSTGPDGVSHLLWANPNGSTSLWTVQQDGTVTPFFYPAFSDDGTNGTIWRPVALSTGGDNVTHILWTNPNGRTVLWEVNGDGTFTVRGDYAGFSDDGTANTVWKALALASGPDGLSHVLWGNRDGRTLLWDLDAADVEPGAGGQSTASVYGLMSDDGSADTVWRARALSVGPDSVPHVLWNNPNGRTILWNVTAPDGTFAIPGNYDAFSDSALPNTAYTAVSLATGGDDRSHFAWDNPDGNTFLWSVSNGDGSHTDTFYPPFLDDGTPSTIWKAVAVSAGVLPPP